MRKIIKKLKQNTDSINIKSKSGITLISLVITIIVLLILVGIAILSLTGDNGILQLAAESKQITGEAVEYEKQKIELMEILLKEQSGEIEVPEDAVARIGTTYYTSLQAAIDEVPTDNSLTTVVLLKNTSESISVTENKNVYIYLNEKVVSNDGDNVVFSIKGKVKITNGSIQGKEYTAEANVIEVLDGGTLNLSSTNVARNISNFSGTNSANCIFVQNSILNIDSGDISNNSGRVIRVGSGEGDDSIVNISGDVNISSTALSKYHLQAIVSFGELYISGGNFTTHCTALTNHRNSTYIRRNSIF